MNNHEDTSQEEKILTKNFFALSTINMNFFKDKGYTPAHAMIFYKAQICALSYANALSQEQFQTCVSDDLKECYAQEVIRNG